MPLFDSTCVNLEELTDALAKTMNEGDIDGSWLFLDNLANQMGFEGWQRERLTELYESKLDPAILAELKNA